MKTKLLRFLALLALTLSVATFTAVAFTTDISAQPAVDKVPVKPYPLDVCLVTDNDLGSMGDEQVMVYEGQTIKFCCKPCEKKFLKNPARYLAKLAPAAPKK